MTKLSLLNFKVTSEDKEALVDKAYEYMDGNLSAWIRIAALEFSPSPEQLEALVRKYSVSYIPTNPASYAMIHPTSRRKMPVKTGKDR